VVVGPTVTLGGGRDPAEQRLAMFNDCQAQVLSMEIPARQRAAAKALAKARFWTVSSEDVDVGTKGDGQ